MSSRPLASPAEDPSTTTVVVRCGVHCATPSIDICGRALLLIGFPGTFRGSEFLAFDVDDIPNTDEELHVLVPRNLQHA